MHFEKKIVFLIVIVLSFLFILGCGEDEIEEAGGGTKSTTAVLKPVYRNVS